MVWQAIGGAALSFGANYLAGLQQYKYQRALQEQAAQLNYDYGQKSLLNSPGSTRKGLESAGYNPMLAVQNATSGADAGWTSSGSATGSQYGNIGTDLISNAQSFQRLQNETKTAQAQQDQAYAEADKSKVEKQSLLQKLPFVSQREKAEIGNIEKDSLLKESQIHNIDETTRFIEKRYELEKMLGEMGIYTQLRGQDKAYNASVYASNIAKYGHNINEVNNIRTNKTNARRQGIRILGSGLDWYHPTK